MSGHAVIIVGGNGFGIDIADGATVLAQPGKKIGLTAEAGSAVDFYPEPDSRGFQSIQEGATFRMHGRADSVTLSTDRDELA